MQNHLDEQLPSALASPSRRIEFGIGIAIFVTVFATSSRLARLPFRSLIKDDLGLPPETMAQFFAIAGIAWYLKPIAGVLSDQVRLFGSRRRHYLMLSGLGGAMVWALSAAGPLHFGTLLAAMVLLNVMAVLGNTVAGGLLVDYARRHQATSRLSATRIVAMNVGSLIAGPLGGWLAGQAFPLTCMTGAGLMLVMLLGVAVLLPQDAVQQTSLPLRVRMRGVLGQFRERRLWAVTLFAAAVYVAPGFQSLLYYYQRDQLGFSDQTIGFLAGINCAGGMLGAISYAYLGRRIPLGRSVPLGVVLCCSCGLLYLAYHSWLAAVILEPIAGFCFVLGLMPIHELSARASPPQHEAFGFALILGVCNAAIALSDVIGTGIADALGLDLRTMIVINVITMAASLTLFRLVPRSLLGKEAENGG